MDRLKQKGKDCKMAKTSFRDGEFLSSGKWKSYGAVHIKDKDYGKFLDLCPITNRYIKKLKQELKAEYRAVKRGENQKLKREIDAILLEETL